MRILVGDRFGNIIAEMSPIVGPTSWLLNEIGKTTLAFAKTDVKSIEENLRIGNRVYIEFDNGLPPWGGTMELPRRWDKDTVSVTCYDIGYALIYRATRKTDAFYDIPAGEIFSTLLQREEDKDPLGIVIGKVWNGGRSHSPRYHYKPLWGVLADSLRGMEQCDFVFTPYLDSNTIKFRADFHQIAGENKTSFAVLAEGGNVRSDLTLEEQGEIINVHAAIGDGSTWGEERQVIIARDSESVALYGLRFTAETYSGVSIATTLEMHARNVINKKSNPRRIFTMPVTNHEPGLFSTYNLGDQVRAILPSFGFGGYDGTLRILGREYNPQDGGCRLVVEESNTPETWTYQDEPGGEE